MYKIEEFTATFPACTVLSNREVQNNDGNPMEVYEEFLIWHNV